MISFTKDERFAALEKRINDLEKRTEKSFSQTNESFMALRDVMIKMQKENSDLKKDRDFLLERYKEVLRKIDAPARKIMAPITNELKENANLIKDVMLEDMDISPKSTTIDDLFELVMKRKKISPKSAARTLNVPETQISHWASKLQKQNLIDTGKDLTLKKNPSLNA